MKLNRRFNTLTLAEYRALIPRHAAYADFNPLALYRSIVENRKLGQPPSRKCYRSPTDISNAFTISSPPKTRKPISNSPCWGSRRSAKRNGFNIIGKSANGAKSSPKQKASATTASAA